MKEKKFKYKGVVFTYGRYQNMFEMSVEEFEDLKSSVSESGILVPVDVDENFVVLDGHHRVLAWIALRKAGIKVEFKYRVIDNLDEDGKVEYGYRVNLARRNLTQIQKRELILKLFERYPDKSDREIARMIGCSNSTVSSMRRNLSVQFIETSKPDIKAPFPYFGGKGPVSSFIWERLGDVSHYLEPFFGSGAVLLNRPAEHRRRCETVCEKDGLVANAWRAMQFDPEGVAKVCDWPVLHVDLSASKKLLIERRDQLVEQLVQDEKWYDIELAGYWIWAASCWIGRGMTRPTQRPNVAHAGTGVCRTPRIATDEGINQIGQRPDLTGEVGISNICQRPCLNEKGVSAVFLREDLEVHDLSAPFNHKIYTWFRQLSERLRYVRVVCGDWSRICGGDWQDGMGVCGIFFDPPYSLEAQRDNNIYDQEDGEVAHRVREWCKERGSRKSHRIILAGYEGEHEGLEGLGWTVYAWKTGGGYSGITNKNKVDKGLNRFRERLWCSPFCID